jgi:hypothetical protein
MNNIKRLAAVIGLVAIAASVGACSEIRPATSAEVQALQANKPGPR